MTHIIAIILLFLPVLVASIAMLPKYLIPDGRSYTMIDNNGTPRPATRAEVRAYRKARGF